MKNTKNNFVTAVKNPHKKEKLSIRVENFLKKYFTRKLIFVAFFIESIYLGMLLLGDIYLGRVSGDDFNMVTELFGMFVLIAGNFWMYQNFFATKKEVKKSKKVLAIEKKQKAVKKTQMEIFQKALITFKQADFETKILGMDQMVEAVETLGEKRKITLDYLSNINAWMLGKSVFLTHQNLILWRFQERFFPDISEEIQKLSIHAISSAEKIIKKHIEESSDSEEVPMLLDVSTLIFPTLTMTNQKIVKNSLSFVGTRLWQANLSGSWFEGTDFSEAKLQKSNFAQSSLNKVNFTGTNLENSSLKTVLFSIKNFSVEQFFSTYKWEMSLISQEQEKTFFAYASQELRDRWALAEPQRNLLAISMKKVIEDLGPPERESISMEQPII